MYKAPFMVDGKSYNVFVPSGGIKRSGDILDGDGVGRVQAGDMTRAIIGTYYNYTIDIESRDVSLAEYDELFETLSAPVDYHWLTVPYAQSTLLFKAYVTNVSDVLDTMKNGNHWKGLSVKFVAMGPARRPAR